MQNINIQPDALHSYVDEVEQEASGGSIDIHITLPSGETLTFLCPYSQTIEYVKYQVVRKRPEIEQDFGLYLGEERLIEPMSLNDYDSIAPDAPCVLNMKFE
ncbi:hypothetical protein P9112_001725 [Eukaryota sp. TZLM1-RC]